MMSGGTKRGDDERSKRSQCMYSMFGITQTASRLPLGQRSGGRSTTALYGKRPCSITGARLGALVFGPLGVDERRLFFLVDDFLVDDALLHALQRGKVVHHVEHDLFEN